MADKKKQIPMVIVPLGQGPAIPHPSPLPLTEMAVAFELLTDDEIDQAVARGRAKWAETLRQHHAEQVQKE